MAWKDLGPYPELSRDDARAVELTYRAERAGAPLTAQRLEAQMPVDFATDGPTHRRLLRADGTGSLWTSLLGRLHIDDPENHTDLELLDALTLWASRHYDPDQPAQPLHEVASALGVDSERLARIRDLGAELGLHFDGTRRTLQVGSHMRTRNGLRAAVEDVYASLYRGHVHREEPDPERVGLALRGVDVEGFRALRKLSLRFASPLTVLVGANGAGKSTLLDAIAFMSRTTRDGVGHVVEELGGLDAIATAGAEPRVSVAAEVDADLGGDDRTIAEYGFVVTRAGRAVSVEREWLRTRHGTDERTWIDARRGIARIADSRGRVPAEPAYKPAGELALTTLATDPSEHGTAVGIRTGLASFVLLDRDPMQHRQRARGGISIDDLLADAARDEASVKALAATLAPFLPHVERLERIVTTGEPPELRVVERHVPRPLPISALSAGARQLLLIAALYVRRPAPRIVLLEEPDAGLHVGALHALRDLLRELATRSVVVATSHSPTFVGMLDPASEVVALDRDGGDVRARSLADALRSKAWLAAFGATGDAFVRAGMERSP